MACCTQIGVNGSQPQKEEESLITSSGCSHAPCISHKHSNVSRFNFVSSAARPVAEGTVVYKKYTKTRNHLKIRVVPMGPVLIRKVVMTDIRGGGAIHELYYMHSLLWL